jgi:hypothetical protein
LSLPVMPRLILSSVRGARSAQYLIVSHVAGSSGYSSPRVNGPFGSQQFSARNVETTDRRAAATMGKKREVNRRRPVIKHSHKPKKTITALSHRIARRDKTVDSINLPEA